MMATSGSIDYSLNAREVIDYALKKINLLAKHETASAEDADAALRELNVMLKGWQKHEHLWRLTEGYINPTANTAAYSLSPAPYRVISLRYRDANSRDLPMTELSRDEYFELPDKASSGIPTQWYFDRQSDTRVIYVWPVLAAVTTETIRVTYQRIVEDIDALENNIDIPQEYLDLIGYNLAARLADDFGRSGGHIDRVIGRAKQLLDDMIADDRPDFVTFEPAGEHG